MCNVEDEASSKVTPYLRTQKSKIFFKKDEIIQGLLYGLVKGGGDSGSRKISE